MVGSLHDSDHDSVVRIFVGHSKITLIIYITLSGTVFPYQERNIMQHKFSPTGNVIMTSSVSQLDTYPTLVEYDG